MEEESMCTTDKHGLIINLNHTAPRFSAIDKSALDDAVRFMQEYGYAVFTDIMSLEEVEVNKGLLWDYLENIPNLHIQHNDPNTWHNWPGKNSYGVINDYGIGQSDFMWNVRANRNIKNIFAHIWNTRDLLVSFDGCGVFRDWRYNPQWKTSAGWYHVDQNPVDKPELCSLQGFAALTDQNATTGGLVVYPGTHKRFAELRSITRRTGDFVFVPGDHPVMDNGKVQGLLVQCKAGDFIAWDSRLVHCNSPACIETVRVENEPIDLLRIVAYVSMSPICFIRGQTLDQFRKKRKQIIQENCTLNHWSTELREASTNRYLKKVSLSKLDAYQRSLVIGSDVVDEK